LHDLNRLYFGASGSQRPGGIMVWVFLDDLSCVAVVAGCVLYISRVL
jgi:hypothetical protein